MITIPLDFNLCLAHVHAHVRSKTIELFLSA